MNEKIIQVSGFGINSSAVSPSGYMLVALTESGKVLVSNGGGAWIDKSPQENKTHEESARSINFCKKSEEKKFICTAYRKDECRHYINAVGGATGKCHYYHFSTGQCDSSMARIERI